MWVVHGGYCGFRGFDRSGWESVDLSAAAEAGPAIIPGTKRTVPVTV